jgi:septum site-determining protein MinC
MGPYHIAGTKGADEVEIVGQPVNIKGIRNGLLITFNGDSDADLLTRLEDELAQKQAFLHGSRVAVDLGERTWEQGQLATLQSLVSAHELTLWAVLSEAEETRTAARELGLATRLPGSLTNLEGQTLQPHNFTPVAADHDSWTENSRMENSHDEGPAPAYDLANALLIRETLRSGRSIYHEGHIIVMGDVNPGAQVIAGGHVLVWGRLRGLVHAGAHGEESAVICALELSPTQLRIASQIAVPPDDGRRQPTPEQAMIRDGQIVAEAWPVRH